MEITSENSIIFTHQMAPYDALKIHTFLEKTLEYGIILANMRIISDIHCVLKHNKAYQNHPDQI